MSLGSIIPGSRGLEEIGENKYQSKLAVRVGPVNGKFEANFELADIKKPKSFRLIVTTKDAPIRIAGNGVFRLNQDEDVTSVRYSGDLKVGDKVAGLDLVPGPLKKETKHKLVKALTKLFRKIKEQCCEEVKHAH